MVPHAPEAQRVCPEGHGHPVALVLHEPSTAHLTCAGSLHRVLDASLHEE